MTKNKNLQDADTVDEWFDLNLEQLTQMLRNDQHELIYRAWQAGYAAGMKRMSESVNKYFDNQD